ncbi:Dystrophin, partial [Armadillidium vulgare]
QSKDFDQKLDTISRQLTDINEQCKEYSVKSIKSEHLESQLNRCMVKLTYIDLFIDIYRSLSLLKSNVEEVISTGRKIVKEGITADPESLTLQLDQLKAFYNQLGGSVTEQRGRLEAGVKHSRKAEKEISQLEEWLSITEKELDLREASHPVKNFQQELDFAKCLYSYFAWFFVFHQHAYDDVMRKKPVLTSIKETVSSLVNLLGGELTAELQERVQEQTLVWERVQKRLSNRVTNLKIDCLSYIKVLLIQKDQSAKTSDAQQFFLELGEIQTWLEKTENSLSKFDDLSPVEKESILRSIAAEIEQYKMRIEETKESSKGTLSDEADLNYRIEPEISGIKRRLEHISGLIKVKESDLGKRNDSLQMEFDEGEESLQSKMAEESYYKMKIQDHQTESIISFESEKNKVYSHHDITVANETFDRKNSNKRNLQSQSLTIDQIKRSLTEIDKISKSYQDEAQKLVEISKNSESKSPEKLSELEQKNVQLSMTSKYQTSFSSTTKSHHDSSLEEMIVSQNRKFKKKCSESKHYIESETEPENLDDVIAGLKEVAEKDDSELIEKARRNSQCKDDSKFGRDRLSLFKPSKRDDDDLESLTSVDTDMAPLSETSRDLECTYSDLESISESISSKGDPLLVSNKSQVTSTLAPIETFPITMDQFNSEFLFELYSKEEKSVAKSSPGSSKINSNIEALPVERLQAMIAELDDVLSSDTESADDSDMVASEHKSVIRISRENSASNEDETLFSSDLKTSQKSLSQISFHSDKSKTTKTSTFDDPSDPIEVKFQAVHVGGDIEFARANSSIQEGYEEALRMNQKALVTTPEIEECSVVENLQHNLPRQQDKENEEARKVSVQSSETSQLIHVVTMQLPQTQFLASAEEAVLVTVESYPGSEESLVNDSKSQSNTTIDSYNPQTAKAIIEYEISDFKNDQWIKTVEDRVLEIFPEMKESKFLSFINKETFQRPLTDLYVRMDSDDGNTDVGGVARSSLNTRHFTKSALESKDSLLHAKKRFGKVYKSDEMTLLDDPSFNKQESKFAVAGHSQTRSSLDSRWSSSSSSAHFSMSEGSVDFGSEPQASWSGDFDDFTYGKIITNQRLSSNSTTGSDKLRFSFNSFGSFETNKDEALFHDSLTEDNDTNITDNVKESSSSTDDDSDTENISKVRISAATMYENEVIMDLETPAIEEKRRSSGRIRSSDLENELNFVDSFKFPGYGNLVPQLSNDDFQENRTKAIVKEDDLEAYKPQTESLVSQQSSEVNKLISKLSDDMEEGNSGKKSSKLESNKNVHSEKIETKDSNILRIHSPTVSAECLDKSVGGLTLRPHLERQLSIDSSVSTLSEAETVIHVDNSSQNQCKDSSVKKVFSFNQEKPKAHQKTATAKSLSSEELNFKCEHSFCSKESCGSSTVKKSGDSNDVELSGSLKIVKLKHISKRSSQENLDSKKNKISKDDKLQKQSSKSLSSVSSGSIEEQEISLDISDPSHSDSSSLSKKDIIDKNKQKPSSSLKESKDSMKESGHNSDYFDFGNRNIIQQIEENSVSVRSKSRVKTDKFVQGVVDVKPRSSKGKRGLEFYSKTESDVRFSTGSFSTDLSEGELIFSETEGEEFPNDDTSDDDLNLEEEALKKLAERKETPKEDILMSKEDNVEAFLNKVSHMIDKISVFRDKGNNLPKYTEVQLFAEL